MSITGILVWLGLVAAPYGGSCYAVTEKVQSCHYGGFETGPVWSDELLAQIGKNLMLGPWADISTDLVNPSLVSLAAGHTVILNAQFYINHSFVAISEGGFIYNAMFDGTDHAEQQTGAVSLTPGVPHQ